MDGISPPCWPASAPPPCVPDALSGLWRRHGEAPLPRLWLGPFHGRVLRLARPVERILLQGDPAQPRLIQVVEGRRRTRDLPPLAFVEERARALGLKAAGFLAYEAASLFTPLPPSPGTVSGWPLMEFLICAEEESLPCGRRPAPCWSEGGPAAPGAELRALGPPEEFQRGVRRVRQLIRRGDCYQVNLVQAFHAEVGPRHAAALFAGLRAQDVASHGYRALLEWPDRALVSDSPELFLARRASRLWTQPIKGTAAAEGPQAVEEARRRLLHSAKDRAELAMIVDLMRNDLSRVCRPGSVGVGPFPQWLEAPGLVHSCATVEGRLRPGMGLHECFAAAFPCGSVTGCPRQRAMERITALEKQARGPAFGALGWVDPDGDFAFSVAIRTARLDAGGLTLLAGGGLTWDSRPGEEEKESRLKTASFARALVPGPVL
jgi:anthranilate/para-aminobenzoate synthase component I